MGKEIVNTPKVHPYTPVITVSLATKCGNPVFISGQLSRNEKGENVYVGDGVNQARQVFANMKALIEARAVALTGLTSVVYSGPTTEYEL